MEIKKPANVGFLGWYHLDLNQGLTDFQSVALPTELWYLFFEWTNVKQIIKWAKHTVQNLLFKSISNS